ncbi:ATP-binding protein [Phenylobacterium sp.]|uniref:hybrid sensor histidine kinase/response regulator n=1 Tax=Phenylobacterium sp. TaxID=1871053 RepID=UPI0025ED76C4|nr:ATP-binding protein [Phenylobacterium sp.]
MAQANQDCIWVLGSDCRVAYMNPRGQELLGGVPGDGVTLSELWPAESRFSLDRAVRAAAEGQVQKFRAFFGAGQSSGAYWETVVSPIRGDDGEITRLLAVGRDVTTEVETHAFLQTVIHLLPSPLTVKNVEDRHFVLINRAAEDLFGISGDDLVGRTGAEAGLSSAAWWSEAEDRALLAGETRIEAQVVETPNGTRRFATKLLATHDDLGPRHLITLADDITDTLVAEEKLRAALADAEAASRAKSAFLANMSHEIRTPLNGVVAGADMLARDALSPRARELVEMIRASGQTLERLVSDILDLARAESGQMELETRPFHAGDMARSVCAMFEAAVQDKGLKLELDLDPALDAPAMGDETRLRQVLGNLISNAVKFTETGTVIVSAARKGGRARFQVRDTGVGFEPQAKARLFDRFQQADETSTRRFGGAGMGLAIARELVQLMGGDLDADARPGKGADFWFEILLPAATPPAAGETSVDADAGLRVLVADDHPTNRQVVGLMLGEVAEVLAVENGAEAVEAFGRTPFDLILMDIQMPVMDGLSAVRAIRAAEDAQARPRTPIIMLTANVLPEYAVASLEAGADLHLGKPITTTALFEAITAILSQASEGDLYPTFGHGARG